MIVTTAMQAGCNVMGEKPMAETYADAEEIVELSKQTGKRYAVMQNRRYLKQIRAYRDVVRRKRLEYSER